MKPWSDKRTLFLCRAPKNYLLCNISQNYPSFKSIISNDSKPLFSKHKHKLKKLYKQHDAKAEGYLEEKDYMKERREIFTSFCRNNNTEKLKYKEIQ